MGNAEGHSEIKVDGKDTDFIEALAEELGDKRKGAPKLFIRLDRWIQNFTPIDIAKTALTVVLAYVLLGVVSHDIATNQDLVEFTSAQPEVIIGFVGVFLGFSTLSVQLHASRTDDEASVTVPFVIRTHWLYLNWGACLGIVTANIAALSLLDVEANTTLHGITAANYLFSMLLICLLGKFLHDTARDAASLDLNEFVARVLPMAISEQIELARRKSKISTLCTESLDTNDYLSMTGDPILLNASPPKGEVFVGVDIARLNELLKQIDSSKIYKIYRQNISIEDDTESTLYLKRLTTNTPSTEYLSGHETGPTQDEPQSTGQPKAKTNDDYLIKLQSLFFASLKHAKKERQVSDLLINTLTAWQNSLREAAENSRAGELESKLSSVQMIIHKLAGHKNSLDLYAASSYWGGVGEPPFWIDIHGIIDATLVSKSPLCLEAIMDFLNENISLGVLNQDPTLIERSLGALQYIHYQSHERQFNGDPRLYARVTNRLDSLLGHYLTMRTWGSDDNTYTTDMFLSFTLSLTKTAICLGSERFAKELAERLNTCFGHIQPDYPRQNRSPKSKIDDVIISFVAILGWCIAMKERSETLPARQAAADAVLNTLAYPGYDAGNLLRIWEAYHGIGRDSETDSRLLQGFWDPDAESDLPERSMMGVGVHTVDTSWGLKGLLILILRLDHIRPNLGHTFNSPPPAHLWSVKEAETALNKLRDLGISEYSDQKAEIIIDLIARRERWGKASIAQRVADAEIKGTARLKEILSLSTSIFVGKEVLDRLGVQSSAELVIDEALIKRSISVPREYFVEGNSWASGFSDILKNGMESANGVNGFWKSEQALALFNTVSDPANLKDVIESALTDLEESGFTPNMIIFPRSHPHDLVLTAFGKRCWELNRGQSKSDLYIGEHEDYPSVELMHWPYTGSKNIVVADASKFLGYRGTEAPLSITWNDTPEEIKEQLLQEVAAELEAVKSDTPLSTEPPDPRSLEVQFHAEQKALLGYLDPQAARRIDVSALLETPEE